MMASKTFRFLISGAPGSGKGTISAWMVRDFPLKHLAAGDLLREQIRSDTAEGQEAKQYIEKGHLVPNELVTKLVLKSLSGKELKNSNWLLDGYPRNLNQAKALSEFCTLNKVIDLHVPFEEIINRIKGRLIHPQSGRVYNIDFSPPKVPFKDDETGEALIQRDDDKPEVVRARLEEYQSQTEPILDYYRQRNLLVQFTGSRSDSIYPQVANYLKANFFNQESQATRN
jgi:nucleoside-triphosphate--adenylate kinase